MMSPAQCDKLHSEAVTRSKIDKVRWEALDRLYDLYAQGREQSDDYKFCYGYAYALQNKLFKERVRRPVDHMTMMGMIAATNDLRHIGERC